MSDGVGQSTVSAVGQSVGLRDRGDLMEAGYLMDGGDFRATVARALDGVGRVCSHSFRSRPTRARWDRRATGDRRGSGRRLDPASWTGDLMEAGYLMAGSDFRTGQRGRVDGGRRLM